jgi:alanyl-tRNA synthetase
LLNFGLRSVLGDIVDQKGSLVGPDKFRFDYSCKSAPTVDQLAKVEDITNSFIKENYPMYFKDVPLELAKKINGLRAVFGEVYPDPVRVVSVRYDIEDMLKDPSNPKWQDSSIEFCGGTHVSKTGDIKRFIILEDSALAKGVRRIVAVTGDEALQAQRAALEFETTVMNLKKLSGSVLENDLKVVGKVRL